MDTKQEQLNLIDMLETSERLIARLYKTFAEHFLDHSKFWNQMAEEEIKHASMVRTLEHELQEGSVHLRRDRFDTTSLNMFHDHVRVLLSQTKEHPIRLEKAFEAALAVEHDMIERKFFNVFDSDSPELRIILQALDSATREHRKRLLEAMEKHNKAKP